MDSDECNSRLLDDLYMRMVEFNDHDPKRILHLTSVHGLARMIGVEEKLDSATLFLLEAAAYTHDVGIRPAEEKFGRCDGHLQEQEGPIVAQQMLSELGFENYIIERICYLIGNHHTYTNIEGLDYQILVEADFLVNFHEDEMSAQEREKVFRNLFKTDAAKRLYACMYGENDGT